MAANSQSSRAPWLVILSPVAAIFIVYYLDPPLFRKTYTSKARIDVSQSKHTDSAGFYDPYFIQNEFEAIKSHLILYTVLSELRSSPNFAEATGIPENDNVRDAMEKLSGLVELRQFHSTALINIYASTSHPVTSADLANKIAEVYIRTERSNNIQIQLIDRASPIP